MTARLLNQSQLDHRLLAQRGGQVKPGNALRLGRM